MYLTYVFYLHKLTEVLFYYEEVRMSYKNRLIQAMKNAAFEDVEARKLIAELEEHGVDLKNIKDSRALSPHAIIFLPDRYGPSLEHTLTRSGGDKHGHRTMRATHIPCSNWWLGLSGIYTAFIARQIGAPHHVGILQAKEESILWQRAGYRFIGRLLDTRLNGLISMCIEANMNAHTVKEKVVLAVTEIMTPAQSSLERHERRRFIEGIMTTRFETGEVTSTGTISV